MDLDDFSRGIANTMAHGSKKTTRPLESDEDETTQPLTKRQKFLNTYSIIIIIKILYDIVGLL